MDIVADILEKSAKEQLNFKPIAVKKHLDLEYDLGLLLAVDNNDLDKKLLATKKNDYIRDLTRDNVQLLVNEIWDLPTEIIDDIIVAKLPKRTFRLPRARHTPKPKVLTKWEQFAKDKGIQKKKKTKLVWDETLKKWIPRFGFRRAEAERQKDWVIEVPGNADPDEDQFAKKAFEKSERVAKNEFQRLRNVARARKITIPKTGLLNTDVASSKDLLNALTVAKASTASVGKFQAALPKEKEARGIADLLPGGEKKKKRPYVPAKQELEENLSLVESVLNKRPKLDIEKAVARHIHGAQSQRSLEDNDQSTGKFRKKRGGDKTGTPSNKKPKGKHGRHVKPGNKGKKRR